MGSSLTKYKQQVDQKLMFHLLGAVTTEQVHV
jgi:hypothetical protein